MEVLSALLRGGAQIVGGVLELVITGFSIKFIGDWTVLQIMSGDLG